MSTVTEKLLAARGASVRLAWNEYLEACQSAHPLSYEEVEVWAWARLRRELARINRSYTPLGSNE